MSKTVINESVSINDITDAIDNHRKVIINYRSDGKDEHTGSRVVEVYAYGLTKAGNPVIRGFQPYGDTTSSVPHWKFFRLDRVIGWKPTNQTFNRPASFYYKGLGEFNPNGDETMSVVYKIAKFEDEGDNSSISNPPTSSPRLKDDTSNKLYKTDAEYGMERLRQQLDNPIKLSDLKTQQVAKIDKDLPKQQNGPKTKPLSQQKQDAELYKTDTERNIERLRKQLEHPITLADYMKSQNQQNNQTDNGRTNNNGQKVERDTNSTSVNKETNNSNLYKTDTERGMEKLRQQLANPKKIDLSKISRR